MVVRVEKEYTVVTGKGKSSLIHSVNSLISNGWNLQGGVSFSPVVSTMIYCQAMTKEVNRDVKIKKTTITY